MILDRIVTHKREELAARQARVPLRELEARGRDRRPPLPLAPALQANGVQLIAEVKRASPSRGLLCAEFDPVGLAATYLQNGAAAISVLTDERFFLGSLEHLAEVSTALEAARAPLPVLRKDFIIAPYQVYEAYAYGADAFLLIVAALSDAQLANLLALAASLGLSTLVEVHDEAEIARLTGVEPEVVGINNRNLADFTVDLTTFGRLRQLITGGCLAVAESGVHTAADVERVRAMGADAVLVGEALVTAPDTAAKVRELVRAGGSL